MIQPGFKLSHYEVVSALGKGGMGEVWRARDSKLGREVAIKTLPEEFSKDDERLARFEREAKLLASLNHPNIATIHERGEAGIGWRLSPDGTRLAYGANEDVWIKHLPDGPRVRITFYEGIDYRPFWTPDGETVTYFSGPSSEDRSVWSRRADGTGEAVLVLNDERPFAQGSWSADGEWLVLRSGANAVMGLGLRDILAFRPGVDSAAAPLVATSEFREDDPAFSPDGRWLAYSSNETGRPEVFVVPFPNVDSTKVPVSIDGGRGPLWAHSGRELFFMDADRGLTAARFDPVSAQVLGFETLFTIPPGYLTQDSSNFYDVALDDQRFLMVRTYAGEGEAAATEVIVVENFFEELKEQVPVP